MRRRCQAKLSRTVWAFSLEVLNWGLTQSTAGVVADTWDRVNPIRLMASSKFSGIRSPGVAVHYGQRLVVRRIELVRGLVLVLGAGVPLASTDARICHSSHSCSCSGGRPYERIIINTPIDFCFLLRGHSGAIG